MSRYITDPNTNGQNPMERTSMRVSWTHPQGAVPAFIHEARVIDVNYTTWTVDLRTQFDQRFFPNVQVSSPYMHANRGEGIYAMPEVNAKCLVCIPSDGPPPIVLSFIMPMETPEEDESNEDALQRKGAVFSGGRARAKGGDIICKGRDGNFIVLHRGGVVQIGATELAQRVYIPLGNIITDISQAYEHHNVGGSINWGIGASSTDDNPGTEWRQTFRLFANDEKADVRIAVGKVHQPVAERPGEEGEFAANTELGIGQDIVLEVTVAPGGFNAETGTPTDETAKLTTMRFFFDKTGNGFLRAEGSINLRVKKKLRIVADEGAEFSTNKSLQLTAEDIVRVSAKKGIYITSEKGAVVINGGSTPVAAVGSAVDIFVAVPVPIIIGVPPATTPGVISAGARFTGFIVNGSSTVLVPKPG